MRKPRSLRALGSEHEIWVPLLEHLRKHMLDLEQRSRWTIEWAIFRWATEHLPSSAIRIDGSEGLTGPAPARWRLLIHIDESGALAVAILEGRAPLTEANVVAAMLGSSEAEFVVTTRGGVRRHWSAKDPDPAPTRWVRAGIDRLVDLALDRDTPPIEGDLPRPLSLALAPFELALTLD